MKYPLRNGIIKGLVLYERGDYADAIIAFDTALQINPDFTEALKRLEPTERKYA